MAGTTKKSPLYEKLPKPIDRPYDIIVDVNCNGRYDQGVNAIDDNIEVTAGIFVIPELPYGTATALLAAMAALALFKKRSAIPSIDRFEKAKQTSFIEKKCGMLFRKRLS